jgi:hypothetical protein
MTKAQFVPVRTIVTVMSTVNVKRLNEMAEVDCLAHLFWDVDISTCDKEKNKQFIIERILKYGRCDAIHWLWENYTDKEIIEVVKSSKRIDRKTANYWAIHYHIPTEEVLCLNRLYLQKCFY